MKGSNTLELNEATIIAALQLYFDSTFREGESPIVKNVSGGTVTHCREFRVTIEAREVANADRS